ncbi:MAG: acyl-CoA/acyl-ACP dehydrogenase [Myxococcales bacterium]|nr:acyl-CoA/acyl-ACP dehydrogenase [Myxococcales bacterium]
MSETPQHLTLVADLIKSVVAEQAPIVDASAQFPQASIDAFLKTPLAGLLISKDLGGMGLGHRAAAEVVEQLAQHCGSTAMIVCMHYAGSMVIEQLGSEAVRKEVVAGNHLSTLAFSESGSRSQFWAPVSSATKSGATKGGDEVELDAKKSWVTSANHATAYVWSSRPIAAEGPSTLWLVPRKSAGLAIGKGFDGLGLRGNDSTPVIANKVKVPAANMLGQDGKGLDVMLGIVLPIFNLMTSAVALGFMEAATQKSAAHAGATSFEHDNSALRELPTIRAYLSRMRVKTDMVRTLLWDTATALETSRADATLRVLEIKAAAGETATEVCDLAMRVCGGAAFRRDVGVERIFRDARAGTVMAPTTDHLYDFIGKAITGMDVF